MDDIISKLTSLMINNEEDQYLFSIILVVTEKKDGQVYEIPIKCLKASDSYVFFDNFKITSQYIDELVELYSKTDANILMYWTDLEKIELSIFIEF